MSELDMLTLLADLGHRRNNNLGVAWCCSICQHDLCFFQQLLVRAHDMQQTSGGPSLFPGGGGFRYGCWLWVIAPNLSFG